MIFKKDLESSFIFVLFLRDNKIRKKTISVTPYLEKTVYGKPKSSLGPGYLLEKYDGEPYHPSKLVCIQSLLNEVRQV